MWRRLKNFLDEINSIIKPIVSECDAEGEWYVIEGPEAIARWVSNKDHFEVVSCEL